jgi:hypothetical protein
MPTEVEIFFDKELSDITFEISALDEWKELVGELGMTKQLDLTKGKESPVPYPYMNIAMHRVFETLCPEKIDFKNYNKTPIPLEVIKQIAFSVKENHFDSIEIWYDDKSPDPVVVGTTCEYYGYNKDGNRVQRATKEELSSLIPKDSSIYETDRNQYLIAKWGDVKRSFEELKSIAKERFMEIHASKMQQDIATLTTRLKNLDKGATLYLLGEVSLSKATTSSDW